VPARLEHLMRGHMAPELGRTPHMIEPAAAVVPGQVWRGVAPPSEAALRCRDEASPDIDPVMRLLEAGERLDLHRRMADHRQQRLVAPDVAFERGDVEVADDDGWLVESLRPARHPPDEVELLPELGIDRTVGRVAPGGD